MSFFTSFCSLSGDVTETSAGNLGENPATLLANMEFARPVHKAFDTDDNLTCELSP